MDKRGIPALWIVAAIAAGTALFAGLSWSLSRGGQVPGHGALVLAAALGTGFAAAILAFAARHVLGHRLADEIAARHLDAERLETALAARAGADAELDHDRRWLSAILRDLGEAVIVASPDHRILLFNERARELLSPCGPVGLQRDLAGLVDVAPIANATPGDHDIEIDLQLSDGRGPFSARIGWVVSPDGVREAYVVSLAVPRSARRAADAPAPRPEFYDFDLARLKPAGGSLGARRLSTLTYVVFDLETTGLDTTNDEIVSIGAVRTLGPRVLESETYSTLVDPGRPIPPASTAIHGIDDRAVAGAPGVVEAVAGFARFAKDAILVAHNAAFDLAFLRRAAAKAGIAADHPPFDTLMLARWLFPDLADHSLDGLAARLELTIERRHSALDDALATAAIFACLLGICERRGIASYDALVESSNMALEIHAAARRFIPEAGR
ncbi:MAG: 3'-5' exonuclease [Rhodospirillales bacterium]|nr:3'-5' exonuclease [Rhodospirillales bacterium]